MRKAYIVIAQASKGLKNVAVFGNKNDAELCASYRRTDENDCWVEEINYHE